VKNGKQSRRRSIAEVRASLERSTQELREALQRLERDARSKLEIGRYIAGKESSILAVGLVVGFMLGMAGGTRPARRRGWFGA